MLRSLKYLNHNWMSELSHPWKGKSMHNYTYKCFYLDDEINYVAVNHFKKTVITRTATRVPVQLKSWRASTSGVSWEMDFIKKKRVWNNWWFWIHSYKYLPWCWLYKLSWPACARLITGDSAPVTAGEKTFIGSGVDRQWREIALWHLLPSSVERRIHVLKEETGSWETLAVAQILQHSKVLALLRNKHHLDSSVLRSNCCSGNCDLEVLVAFHWSLIPFALSLEVALGSWERDPWQSRRKLPASLPLSNQHHNCGPGTPYFALVFYSFLSCHCDLARRDAAAEACLWPESPGIR